METLTVSVSASVRQGRLHNERLLSTGPQVIERGNTGGEALLTPCLSSFLLSLYSTQASS
ncbi:hypothetical protein scyTo_0012464, partial [Scyliorhinus torazame]|nr:hypothetical protein [Scyliorhinus torazame]